MSELKVLPLLWRDGSEEANPELHRLARIFAEENLSQVPDFKQFMRTWLLVETEKDALIETWGVMSLKMIVDTPLFHMRTPEKNREAIAKFSEGYKLLSERGRVYLADQGLAGQEIMVHVSEESDGATMLKYLTKRLGLRPSHRMLMEV